MSWVIQEEETESQREWLAPIHAQLVNWPFTQIFQIPKSKFFALSQVVSRMGHRIIWGLRLSRLEGDIKATDTTLYKSLRNALYIADMWPTANCFFYHLKTHINEFMTWKLYFEFHYKGPNLFERVLKFCVFSFPLDKFCTGSVPVRLHCLIRSRRWFGLKPSAKCPFPVRIRWLLVSSWWCLVIFRIPAKREYLMHPVKRQLYHAWHIQL